MDDDIESQAPHGDTRIIRRDDKLDAVSLRCLFGVSGSIVALLFLCTLGPLFYYTPDTWYSVRIDSVSGLDPSKGLSFNLTLGVESRSHGAKACISPGMFVDVFYHGVQIAISDPKEDRQCAGPRKTVKTHVMAKATGVPLGHLLDSLAADMKLGAALFDVKLHLSPRDGSDGFQVLEFQGMSGR